MKKIFFFIALIVAGKSEAQQSYTVTDSMPQTINGLKAGYNIINEKEKEVGNKGDFSRFSIEFYVTNTSSEARIILYKQGFNLLGNDVSSGLVRFRCLNATGARLTSKEISLQAKPCTLQALIDDKDCSTGKITQSKRPAQIGYWIKPGETISTRSIMIVPLNERPNMTVTLFPNLNSMTGSTINTSIDYPASNNNTQFFNSTGFVKIRNFSANTYLNIEGGPLICSAIQNDWWSAQWEILPVNGTNYYVIKNRWKKMFISTDVSNSLISANDQSANSMWVVEPVGNSNTYNIRNAVNNSYLNIKNGTIQSTLLLGDQVTARWIIEQ